MCLLRCLNGRCSSLLASPDAEHRYCPKCGTVRIIADPPTQAESQRLIKVGYDSFGERSRNFYAHSSLSLPPTRVEPFSALPEGYRPLLPSPWVTRSLHHVEDAPVYENGRREFGEAIADLVIGHGRIWIVFRNGALQAYSCTTLEPVTTFERGEWRDSTDNRLFLSTHFLYSLGRRQGNWVLRTIDAVSGDPEPPPLVIEFERPTVLFDGIQGVILGRDKSGRFTVQRLKATQSGVLIEGEPQSMKVSNADPQGTPWWGQLSGAIFVLCPDGGLRRWVEADQRFETEWPNESRSWVGHPHSWRDELLFPVASKSSLRLLRVSPGSSVREEELSPHGGRERRFPTCIVGERVYFLTQDRQLTWHVESYHLPTGERESPQPLGGSADLIHVHLQSAAVKGVPYVLVSGRSANKWTFWGWNVRESRLEHQLAGAPHADETISFHWEGANTWMVRHSHLGKGGLIQCLPV